MSHYGYYGNILPCDLSVHRVWIEQIAELKDSRDMSAKNVSARCGCTIAGWVGMRRTTHATKLYSAIISSGLLKKDTPNARESLSWQVSRNLSGRFNLFSPGGYSA